MNDYEDKVRAILVEFAVSKCTGEAARIAIDKITELIKSYLPAGKESE